jgi:protease-4
LLVSLVVNLVQFSAMSATGSSLGTAAFGGSGLTQKKSLLSEEVVMSGRGPEKIVVVSVEGMITSMDSAGLLGGAMASVATVKDQLERAGEDDRVKAVVLRIQSPGGEVTASDTLYHAVKSLNAKKPVVVHMDAMAASGGYYIACGARKVVASETTLTGSIGVIIDTVNYSGLFEKVGLDSNTFVSGAFKDSLNGARPMRDDEKAYVQGLVATMYERFLSVVSEARGISKEDLRRGAADGRVFTGKEALEARLVDQVGYLEDAVKLARELGDAEEAPVLRYRREMGLLDLLGSASQAGLKQAEGATLRVELAPSAVAGLKPGLPYYLAPIAIPGR